MIYSNKDVDLKVYEYEFLEFHKGLLHAQKKIKSSENNDFFEYIEENLKNYSDEGWDIFQPTILGLGNAQPFNVIVFMERVKK